MQFACESIQTVISPSLSETAQSTPASKKWNIQSASSSEETPKRLKRKIRRNSETKPKKSLSPFIFEEEPFEQCEAQKDGRGGDFLVSSVEGFEMEDQEKVSPNSSIDVEIESDEELVISSPCDTRVCLNPKRPSIEEFFNSISSDTGSNSDDEGSLGALMKTNESNGLSDIKNEEHFKPKRLTEKQLTEEELAAANESEKETWEQKASEGLSDAGENGERFEQMQLVDEDEAAEYNRERVRQRKSSTRKLKGVTIGKNTYYVLEQNMVVYLLGAVRVRVIRGAIEVLGYTITNDGKQYDLYSPKGTSLLYLRGFYFADQNGQTAESDDLSSFIEQQTYDSSIILCEKLEKPHMSYVEKHISQQIYPTAGYIFQDRYPDLNVIKTCYDWDRISDSIAPHSKVFVCGGKGVGKSTFIRYTINRLLEKYKQIRFVDLDPGQPEFTVPGCVSAHSVTEPLFGPNYTHIRKPERCMFLPNVNIAYDPKEYLCAIQELLSAYQHEEDIPTLINYMGFTQGIGLHIACSAIAELKPTMLVQIQSSNRRKNFTRLLTPDCVVENLLIPCNVVAEELSYEFVVLRAMSDDVSGFSLQPRQIREMCTLAYLCQTFPDGVSSLLDTNVAIYKTSLDNLSLIADGTKCEPAVVNANLVGLCSVQKVYNDFTIYNCHGWGVVRGIDPSTKELFLLTPESPSTLEVVTHLVYGRVNLPPSVYMTAEDVSGVVPYVSLGTLQSFSSIPKRSHLLPNQFKRK